MTRLARSDLPGLSQYITLRGNHRTHVFVCADDRRHFLAVMGAAAHLHGVAVHAYVLLRDHVQLLATPATAAASGRMMRTIACRYVQYFNRRYGRSGTLWAGCYQAVPVEIDSGLLACHRDIELYPVHAGLVAVPAAFRWSSHCGNLGLVDDTVLVPHPVLATLGTTPAGRRRAYLRLFEAALEPQSSHHGPASAARCATSNQLPNGSRTKEMRARRPMS